MPPTRKKVIDDENSEDDFEKPRRSSLHVNLSFMSNLSDSDNGSSDKNEPKTRRTEEVKKDLPPKVAISSTPKKERKLPKIINIQRYDQVVNENCSTLRNVILRKTNEFFEKESEYAIKTRQVLQDGSAPEKSIDNSAILEKKAPISEESSIEILEENLNSNKSNLSSPGKKSLLPEKEPKKSLKSMVLEMSTNTRTKLLNKMKESKLMPNSGSKSMQKSPSVRLALRDDQQIIMSPKTSSSDLVSVNEMKTPLSARVSMSSHDMSKFPQKRLFSDENFPENIASNSPEARSCQKSPSSVSSPILSGNFKKRSRFALLKRERRREENENSKVSFSELSSTSLGNKSQEESCMEITKMSNVLPITVRNSVKKGEDFGRKKVEESFKGSQDKRILSMDLTDVKGQILEANSLRIRGPDDEEESCQTNRTSLNVNTSIDTIPEGEEKAPSSSRQLNKSPENSSFSETSFELNNSPEEVRKKKSSETLENCSKTNLIDSRKKMHVLNNTDIKESRQGEKIVNDSKKSELVSSESKKKFNLSLRRSSESKSSNCVENTGQKESFNCFLKPGEKRNSRSSTGMSCVEGTPFPVSRSFMWKSQIKQNTLATNLNSDSFDESEESAGEIETKRTEKSKELARHPALENLELKESSSSKLTTDLSKSSRTEESSDNSKKYKKKKLYPLRGHSQLFSISPVKSDTPSPKQTVFPPRRKNRKWKKIQEEKQKILTQKTQNTRKRRHSTKTQEAENNSDSSTDDSETELTAKSVKRKKPRRVLRKKIVIKPIPGTSTQKKVKETQSKTIIENNSYSGSDFEPIIEKPKEKKTEIFIVMSGYSNEDKSFFKTIVKQLGRAKIETKVSKKTTHVVSTGVRTINFLKGILRGCWLVNSDWILQSLEANHWIKPEKFELQHFLEAAKINREDRILFGRAFVPELFATCGLIHVENGTSPAPAALKDLIKTAGGHIAENLENAKIIVGPKGDCLKEIWILDSITSGKLQPIKQYRRK